MVVVDGEGGGHDALASWCGPVEALVLDLGDEDAAAEFGDEPGGPSGASSGFLAVSGWSGVQELVEVVVTGPGDVVRAVEDGCEQG